jgi:hypothetical protein
MLAALLAAPAVVALRAHPGAATDVVLELAAHRLEARLTTNAEALLLKLEALAGEAGLPRPSTSIERRDRLERLQTTLLAHVHATVDGVPAPLAWRGLADPDAAADRAAGKIVVRLESELPSPDSAVTWRTDLVMGSYAVIVPRPDDDPVWEWVQGPDTSAAYRAASSPASPSTAAVVWTAIGLGFLHIIPRGLDHILFVLGLCLLAARTRTVVVQASVFTLAHTITLGLTIYGVIGLPAAVVEPLIALSIVYVAFENMFVTRLTRARLALVFVFGLLHGMGFAGVLAALPLPRGGLVATLVGFNVGVELGQVAVIALAALAVRLLALPPARHRRWVVRPVSMAIALVGAFWVIERISA